MTDFFKILICKYIPSRFLLFRQKSHVKFSVIIPTYNRAYLLNDLLKSWEIVKANTKFEFELIFSDDGSTDHTLDILQSNSSLNIRIVQNAHAGPAMARNKALSIAIGDKILFLGDDIFPNPNLLNQHFATLKNLPISCAVLGKIDWHKNIPVNHLMQHITEIGNEQFSFNRMKPLLFIDFRHFYTSNLSIDRKFLMREKGPFSAAFYKVNFEDVELGYRLSKRGMKIFYYPFAGVQHHHIYSKIDGFCLRQETAGEMGYVFKKLHPEVDWVLQFESIAHNWGKELLNPSNINSAKVVHNIIHLVQELEDNTLYDKYSIRENLSNIYLRLFRFYYEKGLMKNYLKVNEDFNYKIFNSHFLPQIKSDLIKLLDFAKNPKREILIALFPSSPLLSIIAEDKENLPYFKDLYKDYIHLLEFVTHKDSATKNFIFRPDPNYPLHPNNLHQILLYLNSGEDVDCILLSYGLVDFPFLGTRHKKESTYILKSAIPLQEIKSLKIIRLHTENYVKKIPLTEFNPNILVNEYGYWQNSPSGNEFKFITPTPFPKNKKIVFIFPTFLAMGGVEKNTLQVVKSSKEKYDFVIINFERLSENLGSLHHEFIHETIGIFDLTELSTHQQIPNFLRQLKYWFNPDLIWICNGSPWLSNHIESIRTIFYSIPILDQQCYDDQMGWISLYRNKNKFLLEFDGFIAINSKIKKVFIDHAKINPSKIKLIYHAVETDKFNPGNKNLGANNSFSSKRNFVFVGRLTEQKRPLFFLEFVRLVVKKYEDVHFFMVGNGHLLPQVNETLNALGLENHVTQILATDQLNEIYSTSQGLIIASEYEGLPISMLEAMCMEVPVFSTKVGDIDLVIDEYQNGMYIDPEYGVNEFFKTFQLFLEKYDTFKTNSTKAAPMIRERFSATTISNQYRNLFQSMLNE
jgi:glycosyltransferase involved in cell wall biosynthesis